MVTSAKVSTQLLAFPNKAKVGAGLARLKYLVIMDPLVTETSEFWKHVDK